MSYLTNKDKERKERRQRHIERLRKERLMMKNKRREELRTRVHKYTGSALNNVQRAFILILVGCVAGLIGLGFFNDLLLTFVFTMVCTSIVGFFLYKD